MWVAGKGAFIPAFEASPQSGNLLPRMTQFYMGPKLLRIAQPLLVKRWPAAGKLLADLGRENINKDPRVQFSEQSSSSSAQRNEISIEIASGRNGRGNRCVSIFTEQAIQNNKLRGAVMQAKDRLHERFWASSLVGNRHSSSASTAVSDHPHLSDAVYWETEVGRDFLALGNGQSEEVMPMEVSPPRSSKHQGLNKIAINNLPKEFFLPRPRTRSKGSGVGNTELEQEVCPVCLEHFLSGEQLIHLACCHRFHTACLTPWLTTCGECPYCRAKV